jgi:very-short-patch-repair endonuclease
MRGKLALVPLSRARDLRTNMTEAERKLWSALKSRQLGSYKFSRQIIVGPYIADFICLSQKLIIELDGGQHGLDEGIIYDAARTAFLEREGYHVMRFWNNDVLTNIEGVLEMILCRAQEVQKNSGVNAEYLSLPPSQAGPSRTLGGLGVGIRTDAYAAPDNT